MRADFLLPFGRIGSGFAQLADLRGGLIALGFQLLAFGNALPAAGDRVPETLRRPA